MKNWSSLKIICAWARETEISVNRISHWWPLPILMGCSSLADIRWRHLYSLQTSPKFRFKLYRMMYGLFGFWMVIIYIYISLTLIIWGKGVLHISHSNFVKLYDNAISFIYFLTLLFIHCLRHPTWILATLPLQRHGEIRGSESVYSLQRHTLQRISWPP